MITEETANALTGQLKKTETENFKLIGSPDKEISNKTLSLLNELAKSIAEDTGVFPVVTKWRISGTTHEN